MRPDKPTPPRHPPPGKAAEPGPPKSAPIFAELRINPVVAQAIEEAWRDSEADAPDQRHEEGGWVYQNLRTGEVCVRRALAGGQAHIDLSSPPALEHCVVVGKFHTHPNPTSEGWEAGPSAGDRYVDELHGVPDLIRSDNGIYASGPDGRRGGLAGGSGFPL